MNITLEHMIKDMKDESERTHKILGSISDASLSRKVYEEGRSMGYLAWHIVLTLGEMGSQTGLTFEAPPESTPVPASAKEIADQYRTTFDRLLDAVQTQWSDAKLEESVDMYGEKWTNMQSLSALVRHEIHHRAQLTVLMRQEGLPVPGTYGPSKEEWAQYGRPALL